MNEDITIQQDHRFAVLFTKWCESSRRSERIRAAIKEEEEKINKIEELTLAKHAADSVRNADYEAMRKRMVELRDLNR